MSCLFIDASRDRLSVGIEKESDWIAYDAIEGRHDAVLLDSIRSLCIESGQPVNQLSQCVVINGPGVLQDCESPFLVFMPLIWCIHCAYLSINSHCWQRQVRTKLTMHYSMRE